MLNPDIFRSVEPCQLNSGCMVTVVICDIQRKSALFPYVSYFVTCDNPTRIITPQGPISWKLLRRASTLAEKRESIDSLIFSNVDVPRGSSHKIDSLRTYFMAASASSVNIGRKETTCRTSRFFQC